MSTILPLINIDDDIPIGIQTSRSVTNPSPTADACNPNEVSRQRIIIEKRADALDAGILSQAYPLRETHTKRGRAGLDGW